LSNKEKTAAMTFQASLQRTLALIRTFVAAGPILLTAFPATAGVPIGTMTAVGAAEVRNVKTREATLFSGDRVRSLQNAYVKVFLNTGHRLDFASNTDVRLTKEHNSTNIAMLGGRLGFASSPAAPLEIEVDTLTIQAESSGSGGISYSHADLVSITVVQGRTRVRNRATGESFLLVPGTTTTFALGPNATNAAARPGPQQQPPPPADQDPVTIKVPPVSGGGRAPTAKTVAIVALGVGAAIGLIAVLDGDDVASPSSPR
jgi:hypothetical protein